MATVAPKGPYAVIATGGKQYVVRKGSVVDVERLDVGVGQSVPLAPVLAIHDGQHLTIGRPAVAGAEVIGEVLAQARAPKVVSYKYKRRKGFHWTRGHRQAVTRVKILTVESSHGA